MLPPLAESRGAAPDGRNLPRATPTAGETRIAALLGICSTARGEPSDVDSPEVKARRRQGVVFPYPVTYAQSGADLTFTGFSPKFYMHRRYGGRSLVLRLQKRGSCGSC